MNRRMLSGSKANRDRRDAAFERIAKNLTEREEVPARRFPPCEFCGEELFEDDQERAWHAEAECIGGNERFAESIADTGCDTWEEYRQRR